MNATKGTKEVSQRRPGTFNRICMDLVKTMPLRLLPTRILMRTISRRAEYGYSRANHPYTPLKSAA